MRSLYASGRLLVLDDAGGTLTIRRGLFGKRVRKLGAGVHASVQPAAGSVVLKIDGASWAEAVVLPSRKAAAAHRIAQQINLLARTA